MPKSNGLAEESGGKIKLAQWGTGHRAGTLAPRRAMNFRNVVSEKNRGRTEKLI